MVLLARVRPLLVPRFLIVQPPEDDHPLGLPTPIQRRIVAASQQALSWQGE